MLSLLFRSIGGDVGDFLLPESRLLGYYSKLRGLARQIPWPSLLPYVGQVDREALLPREFTRPPLQADHPQDEVGKLPTFRWPFSISVRNLAC